MKLSTISRHGQRLRSAVFRRVDSANWRRATKHLRLTREVPTSKHLLICDLFPQIAAAKAQSLYAAALCRQGYDCTVLLENSSPNFERLYSSVVPTRFIYLNDYMEPTFDKRSAEIVDDLLSERTNFERLVAYEWNGFRIGKNAISFVLRKLATGALDYGNDEHIELARQLLTRALSTASAVPAILDHVDPDIAIFLERGYSPAGEIFDGCILSGIDTIHWSGAPQSNCMLFKRYDKTNRDQHPLALSDQTWHEMRHMQFSDDDQTALIERLASHYQTGAWYNRQRLQDGKSIKSKSDIYRQLNLDPAKKTAVIFSHIFYDATFFYGDSLFDDYRAWLVETVRGAIKNTNLNWIVKVHPVNLWRAKMDGSNLQSHESDALEQEFGSLPGHIKILSADTDINTYSLFSSIDYGLTVRGTIGMELPCFGIPTVTAGTGRYNDRGFTIDPKTVPDFNYTVASLHTIPSLNDATMSLARKYAFGTFFLRPIPLTSFNFNYEAKTFGLPELKSNVTDVCKSTELTETADLGRIAEWMVDGRMHDLLNQSLDHGCR